MSPKHPLPEDFRNHRVEALVDQRNAADRARAAREQHGVEVSPLAAAYQRGFDRAGRPELRFESLTDFYRLSATG
jgi:hypothetical protein